MTCPCCLKETDDVELRRRNTAYVVGESVKNTDQDPNMLFSCGDCHKEDWAYYQGLWDEYWRGVL